MKNNLKYDVLGAYREMLQEDGVAPAGADGAMGSAPYMDQFQTNPKLSVYNHQTKKKKCFTSEEDMDEYLKENPDWTKEEIEEAEVVEAAVVEESYFRADSDAAATFLYKNRFTLDSIFSPATKGNDFNKKLFDKFVKDLQDFDKAHVTKEK
jgi:hypothetical protein